MNNYRVKRSLAEFKIKASEEADVEVEIEGFITTFEDPENHDSYGEIVAKDAIVLSDLTTMPMLNSHQNPIGTWREFSIKEARKGVEGVYAKGVIADSPEGKTVAKLIRLKSIEGLSIGFYVKKGGEEELMDHMTDWGYPVIKLTAIDPREASPTSFPANKHATIAQVRSERREKHLSRNPTKHKRIRTKAENFSSAVNNFISETAEGDDALTEEMVIESLMTALDLPADAVSSLLDGSVLLSTMEQLEAVAEALVVDLSTLLAEVIKDVEVFMMDEDEADPEDGDEDEDDDLTEEQEAELLAQLEEMSNELEAAS